MTPSLPIQPVILSGGAGSRLWPLSREQYPKQFLPLVGDGSLFEGTLARVAPEHGFLPPLVIGSHHHRFLMAEAARETGTAPAAIVLEPVAKNTLPALAVAALLAARDNPDRLLLVLPSDHVITDPDSFRAAVWAGAEAASQGHLTCFGMTPDRPETGYGYIRAGAALTDHATHPAFRVDAFREKPDRKTAETYLAQGGYSWNSGMFLMRAGTVLDELEAHTPGLLSACRAAIGDAREDLDFLRLNEQAFKAMDGTSIDYGLMEKTDRAAVVPARFGWSDLGSYSALAAVQPKDGQGNVTRGDVMLEDCTDCYINGDGLLVAGLGLNGISVVATEDALLVARTDRDQDIKRFVTRLKEQGRPEATVHRTRHRPWGFWRRLVLEGDAYEVREVMIRAGEEQALQYHQERTEHWVVVSGKATLERGEDTLTLGPGESTCLPPGVPHRLSNRTDAPVTLIEVRTGTLSDTDVVRL
ncbi:mannose-1-phosphate guanylyltransferase/mannose-6-phosphate isomerase [Yunchengibacter salinarum]|uniref:mannose-1-phosphate guanylyltransferase/mannose-6-phosphate isomerase n=1 Tax=Yunchengibacter salinarum TaxID=3133399 RepID=UPI0035B663F9